MMQRNSCCARSSMHRQARPLLSYQQQPHSVRRAARCQLTKTHAEQTADVDHHGSTSMGRRHAVLLGGAVGAALLEDLPAARAQDTTVTPSAPPCAAFAKPSTQQLRTRQNINTLTDDQLALFRKGVQAMQARDASIPTSWRFQADIHGTARSIPDKYKDVLNSCKHSLYPEDISSPFTTGKEFLAWHRGYLFFFERILQKAAGPGGEALALPYWNWRTDLSLPAAYGQRTYTDAAGDEVANPLYVRPNNRGLALGVNLKLVDVESVDRTLGLRTFFNDTNPRQGFNVGLENDPHNSLHVAIGLGAGLTRPTQPWMLDPQFAARDPVFWAHHANVDRCWNIWLTNDSTHINPNDRGFLSTRYQFVDADESTVCVTIGDIIDATKLGYEYDDTPNPALEELAQPPPVARRAFVAPLVELAQQPTATERVEVASSAPRSPNAASASTPRSPTAARESALLRRRPITFADEEVTLKPAPDSAAATEEAANPGSVRYEVEVEGLSYLQAPSFSVAVVLTTPSDRAAGRAGERLGFVNFFSSPTGKAFVETFDATDAVAALRSSGRLTGDEPPLVVLQKEPWVTPVPGSPDEAQMAADILQAAIDSATPAGVGYVRVNLIKVVSR